MIKMFRLRNNFKIVIVIVGLLLSPSGSDAFGAVGSYDQCLRPGGKPGICKNIKECKPLYNLLIKGKSRPQPWVLDFLKRSHCGFEGFDPVVCCPVAVVPKDNHASLNLTIRNTLLQKFLNKSCGLVQTLDKVFGGTATAPTEFPWMALIRYMTKFGPEFRCGGSLISSRYVLTAAHCVTSLKDIHPTSVRLGEHDLEDSSERPATDTVLDVDIEELIPHPNFNKIKLRNDIALIKLAKSIKFKDSIRPICLPITTDLTERRLNDDTAVVAGWGATETGFSSSVLRKLILPIVPLEECSKIYKRIIPITEAQICAGGEPGKDTCTGDSGGPLHTFGVNPEGEPAYIQQGIVSFGPKTCGTDGLPGVYTRVSHYVDWILENVKE